MLKLGGQVCAKTLLSNFIKSVVVERIKQENQNVINSQIVRKTSFFAKYTKEELWKGTVSVSNAGKKKGRGKDKNLMQKKSMIVARRKLEGDLGVVWPGYNTHVLKDNQAEHIRVLPKVEKKKIEELEVKQKRRQRVHPLERGWSGRKLEGKKLGPPEPFDNYKFDGFESVVLQFDFRVIMSSIFGRRKVFTAVVATGNGDGLIGVAEVEKLEGRTAVKVAMKKASKKLISIDLIEKHTVNHSFCSEHGRTRVLVFKMPQGYGLRCHRAIREICKLVGIENLHAKVEGSCNKSSVIKAFIVGLLRQKTYQEIADEKKLHLVEFRGESLNYPLVLASPKECLPLSVARRNPVIFNEYIMGGKLVYRPDKRVPFYERLPSWEQHLLKTLYHRNHDKVKIDLLVKYGAYHSHLTSIYPECTGPRLRKAEETTPEEIS